MDKNKLLTREDLKRMAEVDIREVDGSALVDIDTVKINRELPEQERIADYIRQIGNPYCYRSHGVTVKISFTGDKNLTDCLASVLSLD